ncbi:MAG: Rpn family recombination-promoting nuclease/putative transposase [Prosthecobacter sp.]|uniref:Rpn family recombination-promoting nuclease/putative transposase n=1 Tax=Prosthecobacter sp. TaxID=1965333 RepID=UPI0019EEC376|nr:Rpn family recombination-promoting nuclease/putative transposase [Prosthecobacter sp.]MBE2286217.1 Rpn family recombination-promoting nuclease/putative transposase [Prosthecobacter sp.]
MKFIDPCNDWAFKRIFGSRESEPVLIGFLNDLLHGGRPVVEKVTIIDPYLPSQALKLKNTAVDVRATLNNGHETLVEMQMFPMQSFCERVLYNGAKCLSSQLGRGTDYSRVRPVTVITVADCMLLPAEHGWLSHFSLQEKKSGRAWPASGLELIFIELPKLRLDKLPASEPLHDWLAFLKNATDWRSIPRSLHNPAVRDALRLARQDSLSPAESQTMTRRQMYREDQKNIIRHALRTGTEQGMQQGMQQGQRKAAHEIAEASLRRGLSPELVSEITGLKMKDIQKIQSPPARKRAPARRKALA